MLLQFRTVVVQWCCCMAEDWTDRLLTMSERWESVLTAFMDMLGTLFGAEIISEIGFTVNKTHMNTKRAT